MPLSTEGNLEEMLSRLMDESNLILLVISSDIFYNGVIKEKGLLKKAIRLASSGSLLLVPILNRYCYFEETELYHFRHYSNQQHISLEPNKEQAYQDVCLKLKNVIEDIKGCIKAQKQSLESKRGLINTFNFHEQITDFTRQQVQSVQSWCRICLLQGSEKSGFSLLAWRIRTELAEQSKNTATTLRVISLNGAMKKGIEEFTTSICNNLLDTPAQSLAELAKQLRQYLQTKHHVLYLNDLTHLDAAFVAQFFIKLNAAWIASKNHTNEPEPTHHFWCFLTYIGEDDLAIPLENEVPFIRFQPIKPVEQKDLTKWLNNQDLDTKKYLMSWQDHIVGQSPDNQVLDVLERLCVQLSMHTMLYQEYILKLDNSLYP